MRLLLLGGTREARQIAAALGTNRGLTVTVSIAKAMRAPEPYGAATRIGGFGGDEGFARYLTEERVGAVLDATHPFAAAVSLRSARICGELGVPYAQIMRPAWRPAADDRWHFAEDEAGAAAMPPERARIFIATGRAGLDRFGPCAGRTVFVRQLDRVPDAAPPFETGEWVVGKPPFEVEAEVDLFRRLGIDWLIARNAGGSSSRAKLDAARQLGLDVAMIRRPKRPDALRFETIAAATAWAARHA